MLERLGPFFLIASLCLSVTARAQGDSEDPPPDVPTPPTEPAPAAVPATPAPPAAPAAASAEPAVPKAPAPPPAAFAVDYARPNRLGFGIAFGVGSASLSDYHKAIDSIAGTFADDFKSNLQISAELTLRYYAPYHLMGQIGYGTVYNWASAHSTESHNLVMEVPILIGGYYAFFGRLYVHGAIGPSILFFGRAYWDPGQDYESDTGAGMHLQFGAEYLVGEHFGFGLDFRYRSLSLGELKYKDSSTKVGVDFDMSGVAMIFNLRVFAI